jgi:hypothetical protein
VSSRLSEVCIEMSRTVDASDGADRGARAAGAPVRKDVAIQSLRGARFAVLFHAATFAGRLVGEPAGRQRSIPASVCGDGGLVRRSQAMADLIQQADPSPFLAHRVIRIDPTFLLE